MVNFIPGITESIQTGAWPRRVNPKLWFPLYTRTVLVKHDSDILKTSEYNQ